MAITSDKLLNRPSELHRRYGGRLAMKEDLQKKMVAGGPSNMVLTKKSAKDIGNIKVNVIKIESILKGTLASDKKLLDEKKRQESGKRMEKQEEKLETKPQAEKGPIKMPKVPRTGFLDWIKNFIGNVILGYFAVRLVDFLPKIKPILKFLGSAADFIIDVGGKLLDGLVTFVDWGYKAIDFTRGMMKTIGGENFAKVFDGFTGAVGTLVETAIIAATVLASQGDGGVLDIGMDMLKDRLLGQGAQRAAQAGTQAAGKAGGAAVKAGGIGAGAVAGIVAGAGLLASALGEGAFQVRKVAIKPIQNLEKAYNEDKNPLTKIGRGIALTMVRPFYGLFSTVGFLLDIVGAPFRYAIELLRYPFLSEEDKIKQANNLAKLDTRIREDLRKALNMLTLGFAFKEEGSFGNIYGNKGAKKEMMGKMAGGGITRGGKSQTGARRTISKGRKGKYKRVVPRKPGEVEIKPGADVGGEEKLFGLFPKPKLPDFMNPFKTIENAGKELGKSDYFGPILAITSKILLGQKPSQRDYQNVGLGINLLVSKGIQDGQLKGGVIAAFAEGGLVDPESLNAIGGGGDISDWVAASFKDATETNAQKTLRQIQENLRLKKEGDGETGKSTTDESMPEGTGALVGNTNAEKVFNFLLGAGFTEQAAAGVIGNLMQESGVNPKSKQLGGGPGRGIMQWGTGPGSGGRWDALSAWAASSGKDPWSLDTQVEWMMKEMRSYGTYNRLKGVTDVKKAVVIFESEMEKAGVPNYPRRYQYAADALASFGGGKAGGMKDAGEGGVVGGTGNFIQGNSGSSYGVHFHIGPGNQTKGDILQPQYNADARASALKALMQFVGQRSVYLGRSGVSIPKGKKISSAEGAKLIASEQRAHSSSGSQGGIDMQVDFESKVPFPLKTFGLKYRPNGFGVSADIAGSKSFVAHGRYDEKGKVAPQEGLRIYGDGGITPNYPHLAILGDKNQSEIVIDGDSATGPAKNMLLAINQAKGYRGVMKAIQQYAPYDALSPQTIVLPQSPEMSDDYDSSMSGGTTLIASSGNDNPYEALYVGG